MSFFFASSFSTELVLRVFFAIDTHCTLSDGKHKHINNIVYFILFYFILFYFDHYVYFPAQLVGGFTLSDLLDKPWSQVSSLPPPVRAFSFYRT